MKPTYCIGIDLGTTNSVLAYRRVDDPQDQITLLPIPQLTGPATVDSQPALPSFLYLGSEEEKDANQFNLPWDQDSDIAVGAWARERSAEVPMRSVAAAKSWLGHNGVNRHDPILPWDAPEDMRKCSPVEATMRYLAHLSAAWNARFPDHPLAEQDVVLTVPASFDASARELTLEAAKAAGLPESLTLLEEPQAAVYAWLADHPEEWRSNLDQGDVVLVCDIGGGTTDFTLVKVEEEEGDLNLRRIAVGNHLLVGGDNMDLLLAFAAQQALAEKGVDVDAWQSVSLWHACRLAKEKLLGTASEERYPVTVLGRGSSLIGGTVSVDLEREKISKLLEEGFFPPCDLSSTPEQQRSSGFMDLGLPFETDTAITRHLAAFLSAHGEGEQAIRPTHVLFNGGVLKAGFLREHLMSILASWFEGNPPKILSGNEDLDFAVARGATQYGLAKAEGGIRIRGGIARSYYLGVETSGPAIPGMPRPMEALCVAPFGMEEGTSLAVPGNVIGLETGKPTVFRVFSSPVRQQDTVGQRLKRWSDEELQETDSLEAHLPEVEGMEHHHVPVRLEAKVTELGIFELWCLSTVTDDRWKLEFNVRNDG